MTGQEGALPDNLRHYVDSAEKLVRELDATQKRNATLRQEIASMRAQLDARKPPPDIAALERKVEHLRSAVARTKHNGQTAEQWARAWREEADLLAHALREHNPDSIALSAYGAFRAGAVASERDRRYEEGSCS